MPTTPLSLVTEPLRAYLASAGLTPAALYSACDTSPVARAFDATPSYPVA